MEQITAINQLLEAISFFDIGTLAAIVALVIAFTKGLTELLKIESGSTKQSITIGLTLWLVLALYITTVEQQAISFTLALKLLNSVILTFFGASGVYNLLPNDKIVEVENYGIDDDIKEGETDEIL